MRAKSSGARARGFTLVELLVVMAIIAILMSLLMPAVNTGREAARRSACANNIRNLGIALNSYHQTHRIFPPAMWVPKTTGEWDDEQGGQQGGQQGETKYEDPTTNTKHARNWVIALLPFIDQMPLYKKFDFKKPIHDEVNRLARGTEIPLMLCASDTNSRIQFHKDVAEGDNWARGNYGANASLVPLSKNNMGASSSSWTKGWCRCVMGANTACTIDEIYDGASNTILLGELRIGLTEKDRRGTWAMGGPGASSFWGHGNDDGIGPNNCNSGADNILGCAEIWQSVDSTRMKRECMGCSRTSQGTQATMRSRHPGGVNVCFVDCSARFVNDFVEKASAYTLSLKDFRTWERINASADRLPVDLTKF